MILGIPIETYNNSSEREGILMVFGHLLCRVENPVLKALVFLISRVWVRVPVVTPFSLSKTLNHVASFFSNGTKTFVMHVKEPSAFIEKRRVRPCVFGSISNI